MELSQIKSVIEKVRKHLGRREHSNPTQTQQLAGVLIPKVKLPSLVQKISKLLVLLRTSFNQR